MDLSWVLLWHTWRVQDQQIIRTWTEHWHSRTLSKHPHWAISSTSSSFRTTWCWSSGRRCSMPANWPSSRPSIEIILSSGTTKQPLSVSSNKWNSVRVVLVLPMGCLLMGRMFLLRISIDWHNLWKWIKLSKWSKGAIRFSLFMIVQNNLKVLIYSMMVRLS